MTASIDDLIGLLNSNRITNVLVDHQLKERVIDLITNLPLDVKFSRLKNVIDTVADMTGDLKPEFEEHRKLMLVLSACLYFKRDDKKPDFFAKKFRGVLLRFFHHACFFLESSMADQQMIKYHREFFKGLLESALFHLKALPYRRWERLHNSLIKRNVVNDLDMLMFFSLIPKMSVFYRRLYNIKVLHNCMSLLNTNASNKPDSVVFMLSFIPRVLAHFFRGDGVAPQKKNSRVLSPIPTKKQILGESCLFANAEEYIDHLGKLKRFLALWVQRKDKLNRPVLYFDVDETLSWAKGPVDLTAIMKQIDEATKRGQSPYSAVVIMSNCLNTRTRIDEQLKRLRKERKKQSKQSQLSFIPVFGVIVLGWNLRKTQVIASLHREYANAFNPGLSEQAELVDDRVGEYCLEDISSGRAFINTSDLEISSCVRESSEFQSISPQYQNQLLDMLCQSSIVYRHNLGFCYQDEDQRSTLKRNISGWVDTFAKQIKTLLVKINDSTNDLIALDQIQLSTSSQISSHVSNWGQFFDGAYSDAMEAAGEYVCLLHQGCYARVESPTSHSRRSSGNAREQMPLLSP